MAMNMEAVLRIAAKTVGLEEITKLEKAIGGAEKAASSAKTSFAAVVNSATWQAAAAGAAGIGVALGTSVRAAIDFESAMADVRKVVPGLESAEGLKEMKQEIIGLSKELPVSAEGLAAIMAAAGQSGIPREELAEFTRQAAQMGVAFDITADEAGTAMAKLRTSLGLSQPEVVDLADAMNFLSNSMASSAAEVSNFMLRAGAVGKQVAMTTEQTAALGSAMIAAGAEPEVAATSFRNLIKALTKGESATAKQAAAFKTLGLDVNQVAKDMQTDAVGTIRDVFQRISQMPAEMRVSTISEVFGDEARAITPLITNMQLFDQAIGLVGDKSQYAGSMLAEFEARAGTSANNFQLLQNNIKALQIAIGEGLLPALNLMLGTLAPVLSVVADLAGRFPLLTAVVVTLTAALAGLVILAPAIVSLITLLGSLKAMLAISSLAVGWAGLQTVVIVAVAAMKGALLGFIGWVGSVFIPGLLAFLGPVGWTVLAIAAVVAMAIAFRKPIMEFFGWLGGAIANGLQALWKWGEPIRQFWIGVWEGIKGFATAYFEFLGGVATWGLNNVLAIANTLLVLPWVLLWTKVLRDPATAMFRWLLGTVTAGFKAVTVAIDNLFVKPWVLIWSKGIREPVSAAQEWLRSSVFEPLGKAFATYVTEPITNAWRAVTEFMPRAMQTVADFVQGLWTSMVGSIQNAVRGMFTFIATAANRVRTLVNVLISAYNRLASAVGGTQLALVGEITVPAFANSGTVDRPTLAMVGDGNETEYIIGEGKMAEASRRFLSGARGSAVIPSTGSSRSTGSPARAPQISITTGPVMQQQDGSRWVSVEDFERGLQQVAEQMVGTLRTPQARTALGWS
jgi:TP901 family phage tail tape measure protein